MNYKQKKYYQAVLDFENVLTCKNIWKYGDALLQAGKCYQNLKLYDHALVKYNTLLAKLPDDTKRCKIAQNRIAKIKNLGTK